MSQNNFDAVYVYLEQKFPNRSIDTVKYTEGDEGRFKIHLERGTALLKVSMELLTDKSSEEIIDLLDKWKTVSYLSDNVGKGVYAKTTGLEIFDRD